MHILTAAIVMMTLGTSPVAMAQTAGFSKVSESVQPSHPVAGEAYLGAMAANDGDTLPTKSSDRFYIRFPSPAVLDQYDFVTIKLTTVDGYYQLEYLLDLKAYRGGKALPPYFTFPGATHLDITANYTVDTAFISAYVVDKGRQAGLSPDQPVERRCAHSALRQQ
ncbi:MAG: hypothetical protein WDN06_12680 [Asticcacaulis sp.]